MGHTFVVDRSHISHRWVTYDLWVSGGVTYELQVLDWSLMGPCKSRDKWASVSLARLLFFFKINRLWALKLL